LLANSLKIIVLFTEKIGSGILDPRFRIRDPGSDIQDPEKKLIPDPGVKKAPDPEHQMLQGPADHTHTRTAVYVRVITYQCCGSGAGFGYFWPPGPAYVSRMLHAHIMSVVTKCFGWKE
jgi:hypothetical protein